MPGKLGDRASVWTVRLPSRPLEQALVPLLAVQGRTAALRQLAEEDPELVVWWGTPVECASAFARLRREGALATADESRLLHLIEELRESWFEIQPTVSLRDVSGRLLRTHPLRAADALQLAAALVWAGRPRGEVFVTLDAGLAEAARLEGFTVRPEHGAAQARVSAIEL